jgi:hypothetical protein
LFLFSIVAACQSFNGTMAGLLQLIERWSEGKQPVRAMS